MAREIEACAKRDNNPGPCVQIPVARGGGQPKKRCPEQRRAAQSCAAPGILGFIPAGLGRGEYFQEVCGKLAAAREKAIVSFLLFLFSFLFISFLFFLSFPSLLLLGAVVGSVLVRKQRVL